MQLLAIPFSLLELASFIIATVAFLLAVRFFITSRKKLEELLPEGPARHSFSHNIEIDRDGFLVPAKPRKAVAQQEQKAAAETKQELKELRDMIHVQQLELTRALRQMEAVNSNKEEATHKSDPFTEAAENKEEDYSGGDDFLIEQLRNRIADRDAEIKELQQEIDIQQRGQTRLDTVQPSYKDLQAKVQQMEGQARQSAGLTAKIDSLETEVEALQEGLYKKEEKVRELSVENARLYDRLNSAEDKLVEGNRQRQQLQKKIAFLEEVASDMQQLSEAAHKLKTETRRTAELESMLDLITEERDALLKRRRM